MPAQPHAGSSGRRTTRYPLTGSLHEGLRLSHAPEVDTRGVLARCRSIVWVNQAQEWLAGRSGAALCPRALPGNLVAHVALADTVTTVLRRYRLLALLTAGALVAGSLGTLYGKAARPITQADAAFIVASFDKCGSDKECVKTRIRQMVNVDPVGSVSAVLSMFGDKATAHSECHWAMHLLGEILKPRTLAGEHMNLGEYWISCNAAILHGAYETSKLPGTPAEQGLEAYEMCFVLPNEYSGHCTHPIGHTLAENLPADGDAFMQRAEYACASGAWHIRARWGNPGILSACLSGVHMNYRDNYVIDRERRILHPDQSPEQAFPQCADSLLPWGCYPLYYEETLWQRTEESVTDAKRLFAACRESASDAGDVCAFLFGIAFVATYLEPMSPQMASRCLDRELFTEREVDVCLKGMLEEYDNEVVERAAVEETFCKALAEVPYNCERILHSTRVDFPAMRDPAQLRPTVDVTTSVTVPDFPTE